MNEVDTDTQKKMKEKSPESIVTIGKQVKKWIFSDKKGQKWTRNVTLWQIKN